MAPDRSNSVLSVVIPCFNEERRIASTLARVRAFLDAGGAAWDAVVVDDGSADATSAVIAADFGGDSRIRVLRFAHNHGKGWAVREGVRASRGDLVLFTDADLSTPIEELPGFLAAARDGVDLVVASRVAPGARLLVSQPFSRRLAGAAFRGFVRALRLCAVRDTQCGFKLLRRSTVAPLLEQVTRLGFAFDVELLMRAERAGLRVAERPVAWRDVAGSKLRLWPDAARIARDVLALRFAR